MWCDILKYNKRITMSRSPKLEQKTYAQDISHKPKGIWYGFNMNWLRWMYSNMPEWVKKYDYFLEIDVSSANIIKIETKEQLADFDNKYQNTDRDSYDRDLSYTYSRLSIDWKKVAQDYDGIEMPNYKALVKRVGDYTGYWYDSWDIDSGCIWNTKAIKVVKAKPVEGRHKKRGQYIYDNALY